MSMIGTGAKSESTWWGEATEVAGGRRPRVLMIGRGDLKHLVTWFRLARRGLWRGGLGRIESPVGYHRDAAPNTAALPTPLPTSDELSRPEHDVFAMLAIAQGSR